MNLSWSVRFGASARGYSVGMPAPPDDSIQSVADFLRREAPFEFERLKSVGRLMTRWPSPRDPSYPAWLRSTFLDPFGTRPELGGAA
jgi:hypothetical protein